MKKARKNFITSIKDGIDLSMKLDKNVVVFGLGVVLHQIFTEAQQV